MPLFITATRGRSACTSASEFELCWPWRDTNRKSTVPSRLLGHIKSNSLFQGKSARYSARNLPNVTCEPTECSSSVLPTGCPDTGFTVCGVNPAQCGFGRPPPGSAVLVISPADDTTRHSTPFNGRTSPAFATVCFALETRPG